MFDARNGLTSLAEARSDDVRKRCVVMLGTNAVALAEKAWALHVWLVEADDWLTAHPQHPAFRKNEERWLKAVKRYQDAMDLLAELVAALERHQPRAQHQQSAMPIGGIAASQHQRHWEV